MRKYIKNLKENNPALFYKNKGALDPDYMKDIADELIEGSRCLWIKEGLSGWIRYIGKIPKMAEGYFVGVELDLQNGISNGSFKGETYFQCESNYGVFLRPHKILMGDYPIMIVDSDDSEIDEI